LLLFCGNRAGCLNLLFSRWAPPAAGPDGRLRK
jgi:hypothetical protein